MKYLAGPMRGRHLYGLHDFARAAWKLREIGIEVFSPIERDLAADSKPLEPHAPLSEQEFDLGHAMTEDLRFIVSDRCTGVIVLPGWMESPGAMGEVLMAQTCGKQVDAYGERGGDLLIESIYPEISVQVVSP